VVTGMAAARYSIRLLDRERRRALSNSVIIRERMRTIEARRPRWASFAGAPDCLQSASGGTEPLVGTTSHELPRRQPFAGPPDHGARAGAHVLRSTRRVMNSAPHTRHGISIPSGRLGGTSPAMAAATGRPAVAASHSRPIPCGQADCLTEHCRFPLAAVTTHPKRWPRPRTPLAAVAHRHGDRPTALGAAEPWPSHGLVFQRRRTYASLATPRSGSTCRWRHRRHGR
jgi:hypothetical protein